MYSACLYCSASLATNEVIEAFPIGRRLAFDAAKGRLWVVCPRCGRWCLSPIEERWEAIEACERAFRDATLRVSTNEIGLVKLREGLELVRVGAPVLPELAAWRYGREYSARRRKAIAVGTGVLGVSALAGAAAVASGAAAAWVGLFALGAPAIHVTGLVGFGLYTAFDSLTATTLRVGGKPVSVYRADLRETHFVTTDDSDGWALRLKHGYGRVTLTGDEAMRVASRLLARANGNGASRLAVDSATARLIDAGGAQAAMRRVAERSASLAEEHAARKTAYLNALEHTMLTQKFDETRNPGSLALIEPTSRLAFEMALHEDTERQALEGELHALRAAWREAEEIAGISDALLVPPPVEQKLADMQAARRPPDLPR